jgi:hypothetical protein
MFDGMDFYLWYFYHECADEIPFLQDYYGERWQNAAQEIGYAVSAWHNSGRTVSGIRPAGE